MEKYLTFDLSDERYGISLLEVKEVVRYQKLVKIPTLPSFVKGVLDLRGDIIPVIDMRTKLGLEKREPNDRTSIIITIIEDQEIGYIVDTTDTVILSKEEDISPAPRFGDIETNFLKCMVKTNDKVVMIMDLKQLFSQNEFNSLKVMDKLKENV